MTDAVLRFSPTAWVYVEALLRDFETHGGNIGKDTAREARELAERDPATGCVTFEKSKRAAGILCFTLDVETQDAGVNLQSIAADRLGVRPFPYDRLEVLGRATAEIAVALRRYTEETKND